jgi:DNA-binding transcriptional MerR regulator
MSYVTKQHRHRNLYDLEGNIIRKAPLNSVTMQELEEMIDNYKGDKSSKEYGNMIMWLYRMYNEKGNPHEQELRERILNLAKSKQEEVKEKLEELKGDLSTEELKEAIDKTYDVDTMTTEDVQFEEVEEQEKQEEV